MVDYVFGHSPQELERLMFQAQVLEPFTTRLIEQMGIEPGIRVLDLGCGAGDVTLLVSERVGPGGAVMGIDRSAEAVELARHRARLAGLTQASFVVDEIDTFTSRQPFDAVIGRYVMVHQANPVAFLRKAAGFLWPGGVMGLHELLIMEPIVESHPGVALWDQLGRWFVTALRAGAPNCEVAGRMIECFAQAGLPQPGLLCERPVGGGAQSPFHHWAAEAIHGVLPHLVRLGVTCEAEADVASLEHRLRTACVQAHAQLLGPTQICAWTQVP